MFYNLFPICGLRKVEISFRLGDLLILRVNIKKKINKHTSQDPRDFVGYKARRAIHGDM